MRKGSLTERVYSTIKRHHPICSRDIAKRLKAKVKDVASRLSLLRPEHIHIGDWSQEEVDGRLYVRPLYAPGKGEDAKKPEPLTRPQIHKRHNSQRRNRPPEIEHHVRVNSVFDLGRVLNLEQ